MDISAPFCRDSSPGRASTRNDDEKQNRPEREDQTLT